MAKDCMFDKRDCQAWKDTGHTHDGEYEISIPDIGRMEVYCGMSFEGGGWITIQRR